MSREQRISRRELLRSGGLFAVALAVPPGMSGCVAAAGSPDVTVTPNPVWEERAAQLERGGILTTTNPGAFAGKEGAHVPTVSFDARTSSVTASNAHPMTQMHWITTHYVRNQDNVVIGLREFRSDESQAQSSFTLPQGTTAVTVYIYCSVHSAWQTERHDV